MGRVTCIHMRPDEAGINALTIRSEDYLLVESGGGRAVHLVRRGNSTEECQAAVPEHWLDDTSVLHAPTIRNYSPSALTDDRWSRTTLCGRGWMAMAAGEPGLLHQWQSIAITPTCRRCLASVDRMFPKPAPDERIALLAALIVDGVEAHGSAEVTGVPGDQIPALRTAARQAIRSRLGYSSRTYLYGQDRVLVDCPEAYDKVRGEVDRAVADALDAHIQGGDLVPVDDSGWRFSWHAWGG